MALSPSRRDTFGPPPRDVSDLASIVRHHDSYLRSLNPGILGGRFGTPKPFTAGVSQLVGGSEGGDAGNDEILFQNVDRLTIDGSGELIFPLTYTPLDGSLHIRWIPLTLSSANWTLQDNVVWIPDPGWVAGDVVEAAYAYVDDGQDAIGDVLIPYQSGGWRFFQTTHGDGTDYSSPSFDDSIWPIALAPFGQTNPAHTDVFGTGWPDYMTDWNQETRMWARKSFAAEPGTDLLISARINLAVDIYINGVYVWGHLSVSGGDDTTVIPGSYISSSNVLACRVTDGFDHGPSTGCYFDIQVSQ